MIVNSINIRGLGERVKRCKLKELVNKEKIDFLAIQETKLEIVYDVL
jgi:exonuclease III